MPEIHGAPLGDALATIKDDPEVGVVPIIRAVRIALAYGIREREGALATMIHPAAVRLSWQRLPPAVQDLFYAICRDFGVHGDVFRDAVKAALFRNTRDAVANRRRAT